MNTKTIISAAALVAATPAAPANGFCGAEASKRR